MQKRRKRIVVNPEVFFLVMKQDSSWRVEAGIPKTSELVGCTLDPYNQVINLFIEDNSFPLIEVGTVPPVLETTFIKIK